MTKFSGSGYIFIGLNLVRGLSIVTLVLLFASSIVTMVEDVKAVNAFIKLEQASGSNSTVLDCSVYDCDYVEGSTVPNQPAGAFWAILNRLLIIFQSIVLIMSEFGWPSAFFDRYFPVLGPNFGLGALGVIQCLLGAAVLSHHVDEFSLVAAFFLFAVGCLNILLGLIFRESAKSRRSITGWREGDRDILPRSNSRLAPALDTAYLSRTLTMNSTEKVAPSETGNTNMSRSISRPGMGFGRQGQKKAELAGYQVSAPEESVPRYTPSPNASPSPKIQFRTSSPLA
ncbi:hypothetical protein C8Q75DRAFT_758892 [Abortiporus biennis]|nr:hypothetical protein C8Q75DRAFT_758892 [Abortiporus biennis]